MLRFIFLLMATPLAAQPNIVFILGDDQSWKDYGFSGHPHIKTPHLDKLAAESLHYTRGYVPTSLCRASLATMITGLYPHQHGITSNDPPDIPGKTTAASRKDPKYLADREAMVKNFEKSPNLSTLLAKAGYVSLQSGKWWEGNSCRCGFSEGMTHGDPTKGGRHGDEGLKIGREGIEPVAKFVSAAVKDKKPFFLWYAPMMPHTPHNPPERLLKKYQDKTPSIHVAKYWAMCEWLDETVGDVLKLLDDQGVAKNTIVVYLHDNGWIQDPDKPQYAPRSKRSPYDGGVRTPILVKWPGKVPPAKNDALASSIDLVPTMLIAAGLKPTAEMKGVNLLDVEAVKARKYVFGEIYEHSAIDILKPVANLQYRWAIGEKYKVIIPDARMKGEKTELFEILVDPDEKTNIADGNAKVVQSLQDELQKLWLPKK